jgi:NAD(P)-dependent dehydrogenase (short-subunit alcohol dehydrogenase family)
MYIIFGGSSEIACEISKNMSLETQVLHITRKVTNELKEIFSAYENITLTKLNLSDTLKSVEFVKKILLTENLEGIVFAHRYRESEPNALDQFRVEVNTPFEIIQLISEFDSQNMISIVLFTSPAARYVVNDQNFMYHASKASINALIKFSALKLAKSNLRINGVSPSSFVLKNRNRKFYQDNPELLSKIENFIPISKISTPKNIVDVVSFLLSEKALALNGAIIEMDGGYLGQEPSFLIR